MIPFRSASEAARHTSSGVGMSGSPMPMLITSGVPVRVPTCSEDGFQMRPEAIEGLITPRTKALMINSPNNPTGGVASPAQLEAMAQNIWLLMPKALISGNA